MEILKPGTLCVIVGGCPENIGLVVEVLEHIGAEPPRADAYLIRTTSGRNFPQLKFGSKEERLAPGTANEAVTDRHKLRPLVDAKDGDGYERVPSEIAFDKRVPSRSRSDQGATKAGTTSASLPLALGRRQFCLDHSDQGAAGLVERLRQLEDCGERGLLLTQFEDAHVSATQVGLKAKLLLRQTRFQAQLTKNFPEGDRWLQTFLPLLEELGRKDMIMSSHCCRNHIWFDSPTERSEWL